MRLSRCPRCKKALSKYKEDKYRWWYKCTDEECEFVCTEAKPLNNKSIMEAPVKKGKKK